MSADNEHLYSESDGALTNPEDDFYFATTALRQRLELLRHLAEFSQQLLLVIAEPGAGKSAMLYELVRQLDDTHRVVVIEAKPEITQLQLLDNIAEGLRLSLNDSAGVEEAKQLLRQHLVSMEQGLIVPLLVVDKAEQLSIEVMQVLLDLGQQAAQQVRLRTVLFGRPQADQLIHQARQDQTEILHKLDIPVLCRDEIGEFLAQLYLHAGRGMNQNVLAEQLDRLASSSQGNPLRLIQLADEIFSDQVLEQEPEDIAQERNPEIGDEHDDQQTRRLPVLKTAALLLFLMLLAIAYFVLQPEGDSSSELIPLELPAASTEPQSIAAEKVAMEPVLEAAPLPLPDDEIKQLNLVKPPVPDSQAVSTDIETLPLEPTVPLVTDSASPQPESAAEPEPAPAPEQAIEKPEAVVTAAPLVASSEIVPVGEKALPYRGKPWLMAQAADNYVLQMLGMHEKQAALKFLKQQRNPGKFIFFTTRHKSKPWYVVAYGLYPNRQAALKAIAKLPRSLRLQKPWARPLGDIHKLIRNIVQ